MRFAPEGRPFITGAFMFFVLAAVAAYMVKFQPLCWICLFLAFAGAGFMAFFFRDPERKVPEGLNVFVSGADGIVKSVLPMREDVYLKCDAVRVSVFLNLHDVHINRTPMAGDVELVTYTPGTFKAANLDEASLRNAHSTIGIRGDKTRCLVRQIVGLVVRRVVTNIREGDHLGPGQRIGLMKFGSRLDVFFPASDVVVEVKEGQRLRAGETVIARIRQ